LTFSSTLSEGGRVSTFGMNGLRTARTAAALPSSFFVWGLREERRKEREKRASSSRAVFVSDGCLLFCACLAYLFCLGLVFVRGNSNLTSFCLDISNIIDSLFTQLQIQNHKSNET
jgi:hypothetical protein